MTSVIDCPRCQGRLVLHEVPDVRYYGRTWTFEEGFCNDCGHRLAQVIPSQLSAFVLAEQDAELSLDRERSRRYYREKEYGDSGVYHLHIVPDDGSPYVDVDIEGYDATKDFFKSIDHAGASGEIRIVSTDGYVYYDGPFGKEW